MQKTFYFFILILASFCLANKLQAGSVVASTTEQSQASLNSTFLQTDTSNTISSTINKRGSPLDGDPTDDSTTAVGEVDEVELELNEKGEVSSIQITDISDPLNSGANVRKEDIDEPAPPSNDQSAQFLPSPEEGDALKDGVKQLKLGETLSMDDLGPMVVTPEGTLRRIANWQNMTKREQANTLRVISARNRKRLKDLKNQQAENEEPSK